MSHSKDLHWLDHDHTGHGHEGHGQDRARDTTRSLNVTEEELRRAVANVGTSAKKVIEYLRRQRSTAR